MTNKRSRADLRLDDEQAAVLSTHTSHIVEATLSNATSQTILSTKSKQIKAFGFVEKIVRLAAFDNIALTLLLVWTGL